MGRYITSVGRYGANTGAFLVPLYGAGEVPQVRPLPRQMHQLRQPRGPVSISVLLTRGGAGGRGGRGGWRSCTEHEREEAKFPPDCCCRCHAGILQGRGRWRCCLRSSVPYPGLCPRRGPGSSRSRRRRSRKDSREGRGCRGSIVVQCCRGRSSSRCYGGRDSGGTDVAVLCVGREP